MKVVMAKVTTVLVVGFLVSICALPQSALGLPSLPQIAEGHVKWGYWNGQAWPQNANIGISWTWDTELTPYYQNATSAFWRGTGIGSGFTVLDIWGIPAYEKGTTGWTVTQYTGQYNQLSMMVSTGDVFVEMYLYLPPGQMQTGTLPASLHDGSGTLYIDPNTPDYMDGWFADIDKVYTTPEPSSLLLLGAGLGGLYLARKNRRNTRWFMRG